MDRRVLLPKNALLIGVLLSLFVTALLPAKERIDIQGSTTVLPLVQILAEEYLEEHPEVDISVSGGGSGVGITALLDGVIDIAMSSREAKEKEVVAFREKGKELLPVIIAYDAIAIIVHPSNPVADLTLETLQKIYSGEITNWQELGGAKMPIVPISRDFASGTFEVFNRIVLKGKEVTPKALMLISNLAILQEVSSSPGCIGYVGLGYVRESVKVVALDGILPSWDAVRARTYPLSRPLYLYLDRVPEGAVKDFLNFILSEKGQNIVAEAGFIPVVEERQSEMVLQSGDADEEQGHS